MAPHWKIGEGFAIRYGGYRDIRWYTNEEVSVLRGPPTLGIPQLHPVAALLKVAEIGVQLLQWWEMRKQSKLMEAQFEERRVGWLTDMLVHFGTEVKEGAIQLDTVRYMQRETARLLSAVVKTEKMDVPCLILMQAERVVEAILSLNMVISTSLLSPKQPPSPNFILPDREIILEPAFKYQPYWEVVASAEQLQRHLNGVTAALKRPYKLGLGVIAPSAVLVWSAWDYLKEKQQDRDRQREGDFGCLRNLNVELGSLAAHLSILGSLPPQLLVYSQKDLEEVRQGRHLLVSGDG